MQNLRKKLFNIEPTKKVSRSLFGEIDHEEIKKDLQLEYSINIKQKSKLWNFDFEQFSPCTANETNAKGLVWEAMDVENRIPITTNVNNTTNIINEGNTECCNNSHIASTVSNISTTTAKDDDECQSIRIVNASPPRPKILPCDLNKYKSNEVFTSFHGKRKRLIQPKIDDFMKKKKRRLSMDVTSYKNFTKVATPIATRLRSLSSQVSV